MNFLSVLDLIVSEKFSIIQSQSFQLNKSEKISKHETNWCYKECTH